MLKTLHIADIEYLFLLESITCQFVRIVALLALKYHFPFLITGFVCEERYVVMTPHIGNGTYETRNEAAFESVIQAMNCLSLI
jgi:hypothetical protein